MDFCGPDSSHHPGTILLGVLVPKSRSNKDNTKIIPLALTTNCRVSNSIAHNITRNYVQCQCLVCVPFSRQVSYIVSVIAKRVHLKHEASVPEPKRSAPCCSIRTGVVLFLESSFWFTPRRDELGNMNNLQVVYWNHPKFNSVAFKIGGRAS